MIQQIQQNAEALYQVWLDSKEPADSDFNPKILQQAWQELCNVIERIDKTNHQLTQQELNEIANHGIELHLKAISWIERLHAQQLVRPILISLLDFAAWSGRLNCKLDEIEFIINALSEVSNRESEQNTLQELAQISNDIIHAVPENLQNQSGNSNQGNPWRVLLLNNAIIATRSNQDKLIEQAYQLIGEHLPQDAPGFFSEAMRQMEKINYPDNVKILARRYYELWHEQTMH